MGDPVVPLSAASIAYLLVLVAAVVGMAFWLRLGVARQAAVASVRCIVQLIAVGFVIGWVFEVAKWYWVALLLVFMASVAGYTAASRSVVRLRRLSVWLTLILAGVTAITLSYVCSTAIGAASWHPRYLIPIGGMLLGNAMTASTLAADRYVTGLKQQRPEVEARLALGLSPWESAAGPMRAAQRAAMMPIINVAMIVGLVKLPGMMTGQILGGSEPLQAAMYQILIILSLMFSDTLAGALTIWHLHGRCFNSAWQLNGDLLRQVKEA